MLCASFSGLELLVVEYLLSDAPEWRFLWCLRAHSRKLSGCKNALNAQPQSASLVRTQCTNPREFHSEKLNIDAREDLPRRIQSPYPSSNSNPKHIRSYHCVEIARSEWRRSGSLIQPSGQLRPSRLGKHPLTLLSPTPGQITSSPNSCQMRSIHRPIPPRPPSNPINLIHT